MEWYDQDVRFNPTLRGKSHDQLLAEAGFGASIPWPESRCVWAFMEDGQLASIPDEETATVLAETFLDTIICFFADTVDHPHS